MRKPKRTEQARPDLETQLNSFSDEELAKRVVRFYNTDGSMTDTQSALSVKRDYEHMRYGAQREKEQAEHFAKVVESRIAELRSKLEQIGPPDRISDAGARADAQLAELFMSKVAQTSDVNERLRFALVAQDAIANVNIITVVMPLVRKGKNSIAGSSKGGGKGPKKKAAEWQGQIRPSVERYLKGPKKTDTAIATLLAPDTLVADKDGTIKSKARSERTVRGFVARVRASNRKK